MMSQHSQTNGASLEDCHTNFFALTDLFGIKWRVYSWETPTGTLAPLEDPVLLSYSRCLAADVLCVWRRTWNPTGGGMDPLQFPGMPAGTQQGIGGGGGANAYRNSLRHCPKELWVFWYGEEPDLSSLISPELTKGDGIQGSWDWETGLSYECRTILFKALHNLIERCLLNRDFVRLGKWFVQPYDGPETAPTCKNTHLSFSLSFFVHGESTVCASVDVRQHPPVRRLTRKHIVMAQQANSGIPVILGPYGLSGNLTGVTYRSSEAQTQSLLDEWLHFFPVESKAGLAREESVPPVVEVLVDGYKLRYPTCFVSVTDLDETHPAHSNSTSSTTNTCQNASNEEETNTKSLNSDYLSTSPFVASTHQLLSPNYLSMGGKGMGISRQKGEHVWQDIVKSPGSQGLPCNDGLTPEGSMTPADLAGQWDFADPAGKMPCTCLKCRKGRDKHCKKSRSSALNNSISNLKSFHHRHIPSDALSMHRLIMEFASEDDDQQLPRNHSNSLNVSGYSDYKGMGPGSVPSMRMTGPDGPPFSVDSPGSVTRSPMPRTPHSLPPHTSSQDNGMPMLSPHPPPSNQSIGEASTPHPTDCTESKLSSEIGQPKSVCSIGQPGMSPYPVPTDMKACISENGEMPLATSNVCNGPLLSPSMSNTPTSVVLSTIMKPVLPYPEYDSNAEESDAKSILSLGSLNNWLDNSVKRFRPAEPKKPSQPLWPPYRPAHIVQRLTCGPKMEFKQEIKNEPEISTDCTQPKHNGLKRSADPYDFDDDGGQLDIKIKEEKEEITENGREPLSPSKKLGNLFTSEGLVPKASDLDDIFDDEYPVPSPPDSNKPSSIPDDSNKSLTPTTANKNNVTTSMAELTKMYPTPPSLEHNPDHDTAMVLEDGSSTIIGGMHIKQEPMDEPNNELNTVMVKEEPDLDLPIVFGPVSVANFVGSERYKPLTDLPGEMENKDLQLNLSDLIYNPSWQNFGQMQQEKSHMSHPHTSHQSHPSHPPHSTHSNTNSLPHPGYGPYQSQIGNSIPPGPSSGPSKIGLSPISPCTSLLGDGPLSQRGPGSVGGPSSTGPPLNYELPSPASNHSSYLNKTLPSVEPPGGHLNSSSVGVPRLSEVSALMTNVALQDSSINLFRDHNFDSCTMCVCNNSQKVVGNVRGGDGTLYLPHSHLSSDEEYINCNCGFSAVVNRRLAFQSGLFYEDEVDLTGLHEDLVLERKKPSFLTLLDQKPNSDDSERDLNLIDQVPPYIFDIVQSQSLVTLCAPSSMLYRAVSMHQPQTRRDMINIVDYKDGNEMACIALNQSRQDYVSESDHHTPPMACVMHKWCYLQYPGPACSQDMVRCMKALQPYLQEAIQKKRNTRLWEPVYTVSGPLTWRQFHRMAVRGTEDMAEPLPIPLLLAGHERDWLSVAPQSIKHWEKLLLEPYSQPRNIAYVVVSPDNEFVLNHVKVFFKELSSIYEHCRLGRHAPIRRVLVDGIMRVSKRAAGKVANESLDDWFTLLGDSHIFTKLRIYSQICCHLLAPHLTTLTMDKSLFEATNSRSSDRQAPSPMPPPSAFGVNDGSGVNNVFNNDDNFQSPPVVNSNAGATPVGFGPGASLIEVDEDDSPPPAIVVYLVDPFTVGQDQPDMHRLITLGLLRCYKSMIDRLPEAMKGHVYVQIVSLDSIIELARESHDKSRKIDHLKCLAFSVFMQCRRILTHTSGVRSLTGFGPASLFDIFLRPPKDPLCNRDVNPYAVFSPAYILAPVKESRERFKEAEEALGEPREHSTILYVTYCLSEDQRWLIASATDDLGEIMETSIINIEIPNRIRRKKASSRRHALKKLMEWILGVMCIGVHPWRLVIGRFGRIGHGELKGWLSLLSRKSLALASKTLREMCKQCLYMFPGEAPCILSVCLVSLEPDSAFRMMPDMFTPDERFGQNSQNCNLSTPQDATCTHILVFPTSATAQSAQQRFQDEATFNFEGENDDLFQQDDIMDMDGQDIGIGVGINFSDILSMDTVPTQCESLDDGTGPQESLSQPGSPNLNMGGRTSPSYFSGQARSNGLVMVDPMDDIGSATLQQQPLALGYYVSTAGTGRLPRWFWSGCPHLEHVCPTFLKNALHLNQPAATQAEDYVHNAASKLHPLDSSCTADVLRFVLEGYNSLSWLVLDPSSQDRRSCLPLHMQVLSHLYNMVASLI